VKYVFRRLSDLVLLYSLLVGAADLSTQFVRLFFPDWPFVPPYVPAFLIAALFVFIDNRGIRFEKRK
jgi:hypothetical protein